VSTCLQIDIGNSSAKWRAVGAAAVVARGSFDPREEAALESIPVQPSSIWVASVGGAELEARLATAAWQRWRLRPWFARSAARTGDLVNSYAEPQRMGVDRWLAMLGARARCQSRLCVVDSGSATTIDLVAADGRHEGGYIIPGAGLMEQSLLRDTDRVRFDESVQYALAAGRSTAEAVRHGIAVAQAGAVLMALATAGEPAPALFFCGGGGGALRELLGRGGEEVPDLVFEGLEVMAGDTCI